MDIFAGRRDRVLPTKFSGAIAIALAAGLWGGTAANGETISLGGLGSLTQGGASELAADLGAVGSAIHADVLNHDNGNAANACVGSCGGTGTGVGVTVGASNGGVGVNLGTPAGGVGVNLGTSGGGIEVGIGVDPTLPGLPGVPVVPGGPGGPGNPQNPIVPASAVREPAPLPPNGRMPCAADGNTAVYNGYTVFDKNGIFIGWVNDTTLDPTLKIQNIRVQTAGKRCLGLSGAGFAVNGQAVKANIDATTIN